MTDEVGKSFCKVIGILTDKPPDQCINLWEDMRANKITDKQLTKELTNIYGDGVSTKAKNIIFTIMGIDNEK